MKFNIFKTKMRLVGVKLFIQEDLNPATKSSLSRAFFRELKEYLDMNFNSLGIFHDIEHYDVTRDPATVYFMRFYKDKNFKKKTFALKYGDVFKECWDKSELENFTWDKYDVNIYPVVEENGEFI